MENIKANVSDVEIITDPVRLAAHAAGDIPKLLERQGDEEARKKALILIYQRISSVIIATRQELDAIAPAEASRLRLLVARSATGCGLQ